MEGAGANKDSGVLSEASCCRSGAWRTKKEADLFVDLCDIRRETVRSQLRFSTGALYMGYFVISTVRRYILPDSKVILDVRGLSLEITPWSVVTLIVRVSPDGTSN